MEGDKYEDGKLHPHHCGSFILISLALAHFISPRWLWFTVFVGANLLQSGITKWCLMESILSRIGVEK
ncbi:YgaP family membrane protein [Pontiella agarivorans]|uniref:YgaP family membrane protein n=1 Tax=Pontiella agarivorans TaxID=3038953 RepID=UPI0032AF4EE3